MPDYQKAYYILCAAASGALEALPDTIENAVGRKLLQDGLYAAEDLYIDTSDPESGC